MKKIAILCIVLLSVWLNAYASPIVNGLPHHNNFETDLPDGIAQAIKKVNLRDDELAIAIIPLDKNKQNAPKILHNADIPKTPASTQKLITTAAAIDLLGSDFVWVTPIYYQGILANGVLYGDLIIKGSGDPALSHERLRFLLQKINHITGDIIIDDGLFVDVSYDANAFDGQGSSAYNAAPNAFLVNFGTVELQFVPSGYFEGGSFIQTSHQATIHSHPDVNLPKTITTKQGCHLPNIKLNQQKFTIDGSFGAIVQ